MDVASWDRFYAKVDRQGPDGHWLWTGAKTPRGYGLFHLPRTNASRYAHRIMLELKLGRALARGEQAQHVPPCVVRHCVNPDHLKVGTPRENTMDMMQAGRGKQRDRKPLVLHPGAPWNQYRVAAGVSLRALARETGLHRGVLSLIDQGRFIPSPDEARLILAGVETLRVNVL